MKAKSNDSSFGCPFEAFALVWKGWTKMKERRRVRIEAQHTAQSKRGYFVFIVSACWPTCGHLYPRPRPCVILSFLFFFVSPSRKSSQRIFLINLLSRASIKRRATLLCRSLNVFCSFEAFQGKSDNWRIIAYIRCIWIENLINAEIT